MNNIQIKKIKSIGRKTVGKQGRTIPISIYECLDCNNHFEASDWNVNSGKTKRCKDCHKKITTQKINKHNTTHGNTKTRLFSIWNNMTDRCYNKNSNNYKYSLYRDKEVTICNEWLGKNGFINFKEWALKNGYKDNLTIDKDIKSERYNLNNKIYSPKTCCWITREDNVRYARLTDHNVMTNLLDQL